jgi:GTPase SAR1 family protein
MTTVQNDNSDNSEMEKILELFADYNQTSVPEKLVFVVGNSGSGKSTLTQFIVGNKNLKSYDDEKDLELSISGDTISNTIFLSYTTVPNLVVDNETRIVFADCPGFDDTRDYKYDIVGTLFRKKLLSDLKQIKLLVVTDHQSVTKAGIKSFVALLENFRNFLSNVDKYEISIALMVTKVTSNPDTDESKIKSTIINILNEIKSELKTNAVYVKLIDTFIRSNGDYISIFRRPNAVGPLHEIALMNQARETIRNLVFGKLKYTPVDPHDFKLTISEKTLVKVNEMITSTANSIELLANNIFEDATKIPNLQTSNLQTANATFNQFWGIKETFVGQHTMSFDQLIKHLENNNFTIDRTILADFNKLRGKQMFLQDFSNNLSMPAQVQETQFKYFETSINKNMTELADQIISECKKEMNHDLIRVLEDFSKMFDHKVRQCEKLVNAKQLLQSILSLKQTLFHRNKTGFTVNIFLADLNNCTEFSSQAAQVLLEEEFILHNVRKVRDNTAWDLLKLTINEQTNMLSVNASAVKMYSLVNEQIDNYVTDLSQSIIDIYAKAYKNSKKWQKKKYMSIPLRDIEPIVDHKFQEYSTFIQNITTLLAIYNSLTIDTTLKNLHRLQPDVEYVLNVPDNTVTLPQSFAWTKKLDSAADYMRNSAARPQSPIRSLLNWVNTKSKNFLSNIEASLWFVHKHHEPLLQPSLTWKPFGNQLNGNFITTNFNPTIMLLDLIVRKFTKTKYIDSEVGFEEHLEAQACAINIIAECEDAWDVLQQQFGVLEPTFDFVVLQQQVMKRLVINNGENYAEAVRKTAINIVRNAVFERFNK